MNNFWRFGVLFAPLVLASCLSTSDVKSLKGDYSGLIADFKKSGGYQAQKTRGRDGYQVLISVCNAYYQLRDRASYSQCVAAVTPMIPAEFSGTHNGHDVKAFLWAQQAQLRLELADYDNAILYAKRAEAELSQGLSPKLNWTAHVTYIAYVKKQVGLVAAFTGRKQDALRAIADIRAAKIEATGLFAVMGRDDISIKSEFRIRQEAITPIYMALKDFKQAEIELNKKPETTFSLDRVVSAILSLGLLELVYVAIDSLLEDFNTFRDLPKLFMQAKILNEVGKTKEAAAIYDKLIALPGSSEFSGIYYVILHDRGRIALLDGDHDKAIKYFKTAITDIERQRSTVNSEAGKIGFVGDKQAVYWDLVNALVEAGRPNEAFEYAERGKARALVDLLAAKQDFGESGSARHRAASQAVRKIARADAARSRPITEAEFNRIKSGRRGIAVRGISAVKIQDREFASLVTVAPIKASDIASQLAKDESLLEFYGAENQLIAFVMSNGNIHAVKLDASDIVDKIQAYRQAVQDPRDNRHQALASEIYDIILHPIARYIQGAKLTIVPHGALHYLPFAALEVEGVALIDKFDLRILPSASVLAYLKGKSKAKGALLAFGNPKLQDPKLDLPFAQREVMNIAALTPGATILVREQATETALKQNGARFSRLHFASHGVFDAANPLASRLLLAADDANDGNLTVSELYNLKLDADLVTLSACETALGEIANGDDVVGFTRGFLFAGARTIISSLWQVDDQATADLMQKFYGNLQTQAPREALRQAQLDLRRQGQTHPFYWAAFQMTGAAQ